MDQADVPVLLSRLSSDDDAGRKMAVFKLQTCINDPAFADVFMSSGGLVVLRRLILDSGGNTLAYSLQSLARLLELDMGWDIFRGATSTDLVERVVELIVTNPLVNILRGAMSILVALVSHSQSDTTDTDAVFGFRGLKPAVAVFPQFFELVIQQLDSADHALCANALMLINALLRDAVCASPSAPDGAWSNATTGDDWASFVKRLHDLGLVQAVYKLMQSSSIQDLVHPLLEFQSLSKAIMAKWRQVRVHLGDAQHRRLLKSIHVASAPEANGSLEQWQTQAGPEHHQEHHQEHQPKADMWRRLGFATESPAQDFEQTGFLGMMDLTDYVGRHEDAFQKLLLEQAAKPVAQRCPIARASLAVTAILYQEFDIDKADADDAKGHDGADAKEHDRLFRPLLLQWPRLHTAGLQGFVRIWKATGAEQDDFEKVVQLTRILVEQVVGQASRTRSIVEVEDEMLEYETARLRQVQMQLLEGAFEATWGRHLDQARQVLKHEALQFVKEQRVRCLLQGAWFTKPSAGGQEHWRYAKLSHNRRFLHYADFDGRMAQDPGLDSLADKVDLGSISSVVSNVSAPSDEATAQQGAATTKITVYSLGEGGGEAQEEAVLTLWPTSPSLASEWLDGLLMLLNQAPITAETSKLIDLISDYGLKIRLLNVRLDTAFEGPLPEAGVVPSREGLDTDYYFDV
ncbi:hypothetical protein CDD82_1808 [Ophiocordyceps australis]|uniref:ELMO domain-containing protein n=1 Tax=Ophiocordyceps australis TaxID=1399860 RepID=A0A2C5YAQ1_9HYPO|nr:hypothetical protein CDD82_1808 [Ophiocordyceps australis]